MNNIRTYSNHEYHTNQSCRTQWMNEKMNMMRILFANPKLLMRIYLHLYREINTIHIIYWFIYITISCRSSLLKRVYSEHYQFTRFHIVNTFNTGTSFLVNFFLFHFGALFESIYINVIHFREPWYWNQQIRFNRVFHVLP